MFLLKLDKHLANVMNEFANANTCNLTSSPAEMIDGRFGHRLYEK